MELEDLTTIEQLREFLSGPQAAAFSVISNKDACYRWIQGESVKFRYLALSRQGKGAERVNLFPTLEMRCLYNNFWQVDVDGCGDAAE